MLSHLVGASCKKLSRKFQPCTSRFCFFSENLHFVWYRQDPWPSRSSGASVGEEDNEEAETFLRFSSFCFIECVVQFDFTFGRWL